MESALPPTASASTMLAPEELFQPPTGSALVARSELTPEEAAKTRSKIRKSKKASRKHLGEMAELYGKKKGSAKEEKEKALAGMVKAGKGVTVIGKGSGSGPGGREGGKRKSGDESEGKTHDGKRLKL